MRSLAAVLAARRHPDVHRSRWTNLVVTFAAAGDQDQPQRVPHRPASGSSTPTVLSFAALLLTASALGDRLGRLRDLR